MALIKPETAQGFSALPALRQVGLMVGLAASVAIGVAVVLWSQSPNYSLLYGSLSPKDTSEVLDALKQANIPFKVDQGSGAVMVPAERVHDARMKLAADGLPKGSSVGFELLQKEQELGTSQFMEKARYQHALEVELARSVAQVNNVKAARVHLAIPKRSVFVREQQEPSASVVLDLHAGRTLQDNRVAAIVHLVSASVPNLAPERVTVVDQHGTLLTRQLGDKSMALSAQQFEFTQRLEETYSRRVEELISPIVGPGRVRAQVVADLDFTRTERTRESYNPDNAAVRSEELVKETNGSSATASGTPGSLSNQPPPAAQTGGAGEGESGGGTTNQSTQSRERSVRNYELEKTISHTRTPAGQIRKLSVAVLVDDRQVVGANGNVQREPLAGKELEQITALVKDAVGFDAGRGDTVNVINSSFHSPGEPEPLPEPPLWEQPWVQSLAKQVAAAVGILLLVFGVLRPVLRGLAEKGSQVPAPAFAGEGGQQGVADDRVSLSGNQGAPQLQGPDPYMEQLTMAKTMASQDPGRVAQVVKNWVANDA